MPHIRNLFGDDRIPVSHVQLTMNPSLEEPLVTREAAGASGDGIAIVTLNRPAQFNALSSDMLNELQSTLTAIENDPDVRVVILRGKGRAFCAGHDLREMQSHAPEMEPEWHQQLFEQCSRVMTTLNEMPQPVIAEVHGIATAAGCQLVAACDLAVAGRSARFATSGINLGLFCSTPAVALTRTISEKRAAEMLFTGDFIDAETAARWGLVNECVDDEALSTAGLAMAARIASKSAHALRSGKALLRNLRGASVQDAYSLAGKNMACDMKSADAQAGISAFIHKQPTPSWKHQ